MLYKHQQDAIDKFSHGIGNIFHDPGLGKTRTSVEIWKKSNKPLLVLCPLSIIETGWGEELTAHGATYADVTSYKNEDALVLNYAKMRSQKHHHTISRFIENNPFCIIDESSKLKSNTTKITKIMLGMAKYFSGRMCLSGTPCPNNEIELWGQTMFADDQLIPSNFYAFRRHFSVMVDKKGKIKYNASSQEIGQLLKWGWRIALLQQQRESLLKIIDPVTHWRKKEECLDLPKKITIIKDFELNPEEKRVYKDIGKDLVTELSGKIIVTDVAASKIMKLRQIVSGFIYDEDKNPLDICKNPSKDKELKETIEEMGNRQSIIWYQFTHEGTKLKKLLPDSRVFGGTKEERAEIIRSFKRGEFKHFITQTARASHGIDLPECYINIFYSCNFSFEEHGQAQDRTHRIGQKHECLNIYLHAKGTIAKQIHGVLMRKLSIKQAIAETVRNLRGN